MAILCSRYDDVAIVWSRERERETPNSSHLNDAEAGEELIRGDPRILALDARVRVAHGRVGDVVHQRPAARRAHAIVLHDVVEQQRQHDLPAAEDYGPGSIKRLEPEVGVEFKGVS